MRVRCYLREHRGDRSLRDIAEHAGLKEAGVSRGVLSLIERGISIPTDEQIPPLEDAYGVPRTKWWPDVVLLALEADPEKDDHHG